MPTLKRRAEITNPLGLHLRAANQLVRVAQQFRAEIRVYCGDKYVSGKSVLDLMTLAAGCGTQLEFEASGLDAEAAIDALAELIEAGFHEID
jgi:phosphocarrier protein HPr